MMSPKPESKSQKGSKIGTSWRQAETFAQRAPVSLPLPLKEPTWFFLFLSLGAFWLPSITSLSHLWHPFSAFWVGSTLVLTAIHSSLERWIHHLCLQVSFWLLDGFTMRGPHSCRTLTSYRYNLKYTTHNLGLHYMRNVKEAKKQRSRSEMRVRGQQCWHQANSNSCHWWTLISNWGEMLILWTLLAGRFVDWLELCTFDFQVTKNDNSIPFSFLFRELRTFITPRNQFNSYSLILSNSVSTGYATQQLFVSRRHTWVHSPLSFTRGWPQEHFTEGTSPVWCCQRSITDVNSNWNLQNKWKGWKPSEQAQKGWKKHCRQREQ